MRLRNQRAWLCRCSRISILLVALSHWIVKNAEPRFAVIAYELSTGSSSSAQRPEVNRQAIAGIWKLTPSLPHPLKEFTVYPKKPRLVLPELLLLLKEDGSFQQYETTTPMIDTIKTTNKADESDYQVTEDIDISWRSFHKKSMINTASQQQQQKQQNVLFPWVGYIQTGRWAYEEGNLLLAADRMDSTSLTSKKGGSSYQALADGTASTTTEISSTTASIRYDSISSSSSGRPVVQTVSDRSKDDTLLKGRVIATYQTRLDDNPILSTSTSRTTTNSTIPSISQQQNRSSTGSSSGRKIKFDAYLSVPRGSIHIGKFMYPRTHPSFFDQPMFQPMKMGTFALRQILGNLNTATNKNPSTGDDDDDRMIEQYQRSDFYNKTFLLTSRPLQQFTSSNDDKYNNNNRGEKRWSIKYNEYVYDAPSSKKKSSSATPSDVPTSAVRVLQIVFHRNDTFSTTGGLGTAAILRGKFDIIGTEKDHLWMQVIRFGFGRSVSGSVYSEGPMLSHEDIKAYWGAIRKFPKGMATESNTNGTLSSNTTMADTVANEKIFSNDNDPALYRIEVEGSVLDGLGLEPMPVARFILREIDPVSSSTVLDDDDDEDEDDDEITLSEAVMDTIVDDDGIDWTSSTNDSFQ